MITSSVSLEMFLRAWLRILLIGASSLLKSLPERDGVRWPGRLWLQQLDSCGCGPPTTLKRAQSPGPARVAPEGPEALDTVCSVCENPGHLLRRAADVRRQERDHLRADQRHGSVQHPAGLKPGLTKSAWGLCCSHVQETSPCLALVGRNSYTRGVIPDGADGHLFYPVCVASCKDHGWKRPPG